MTVKFEAWCELSHPAGVFTNTASPCWLEEGDILFFLPFLPLVFLVLGVIRSDQIRVDQVRHALFYLKIQILTMSSKKLRFHYSVIPRNEKEESLCDATKGSDASPGFVTGPRAGWDAFCPPYLSSLQTHEGSNNVLEHSFEECCKQRANKC